MNKALVTLAFLITLMAASVPSREEHINELEAHFVRDLQRELQPKSGVEMIGAGFASLLGGGVLKALLKVARFQSYVALSTLSIPPRGAQRGELLSVGVLGQVIIIKDLDQAERGSR